MTTKSQEATPAQIEEWLTKAETAWIVSSDTDAMFSNKGSYEAGYIYAKTEQSAEIAHLVESLHSATNLGIVWATEIAELKAKLAEAESKLLAQPKGEPICWLVETEKDSELGILPYTVICETEYGAGIREMLGAFQVYKTPHPAPFTPITADDVTDEMVIYVCSAINRKVGGWGTVYPRDLIAAAVNAWGAKK